MRHMPLTKLSRSKLPMPSGSHSLLQSSDEKTVLWNKAEVMELTRFPEAVYAVAWSNSIPEQLSVRSTFPPVLPPRLQHPAFPTFLAGW